MIKKNSYGNTIMCTKPLVIFHQGNNEYDRQCTYNTKLSLIHVTNVAKEKQ